MSKNIQLKIKYKSGETRQITNNLNKKQAESLVKYMKSGNYGMKEAKLTARKKK